MINGVVIIALIVLSSFNSSLFELNIANGFFKKTKQFKVYLFSLVNFTGSYELC